MSRLTELIRQAKEKDPALGAELEREYRTLSGRRAFGLNFERHRPEAVELPGRPVRRGDKVRILVPRGSVERGDQRLWRVARFEKAGGERQAHLEPLGDDDRAPTTVADDDLVMVAEFRDPIHPGLVSTGGVRRGGDKPAHTVINGENFHVLKALTFTHRGKVDAIYIDPPYNTGAKDWKYNNDYVEGDDLYRHSKWLAFMERRLLLAKELLNPEESVLIVTIDEKEYLRLGLLLEQTFPEARLQMVTSVISPAGTQRVGEFTRTNEFIFFVRFGASHIGPELPSSDAEERLVWHYFQRQDMTSRRGQPKGGKAQFYPIYVNRETGRVDGIGEPLPHDAPRSSAPAREGCVTVFPVRPDGTEMNWCLTGKAFLARLAGGYVKVGGYDASKPQPYPIYYLLPGKIDDIEAGRAVVTGYAGDGSVEVEYREAKRRMPSSTWTHPSHNARVGGTEVLKVMMPGRHFPFPKSVYAVEDCLRLVTERKPDAVILDFFAGSGTTAHAVMRLNKQDGGRRQCILVTNNEVSADEQRRLRQDGLRPGDPDWEALGICDNITKPRIEAAITGRTPEGEPIAGDYRFTDEFPMADGFQENTEFFTLTYENPVAIGHNRAFGGVAPLLWLRAGATGRRIDTIPDTGWDMADIYGILWDLDQADEFAQEVEKNEHVHLAYVVTDDDRRFQSVARQLPDDVDVVRLYESYLSNFRFTGVEP